MATPDNNHYKNLFQKMAIPRFLISVSDAGAFAFAFSDVNDLALKYFDLKREQIVGKSLTDILNNEGAVHFEQSFEVCIEKKRSVTIQALPGMPGGIRIYGFYITPITDDNDKVTHLDVVGHLDVADQSILQRERDDAISLLTSIFEVSEIGIVVTDHNRRVVRVNDSFVRTYGWKREELINTDVVEFITPDEREQAYKNHDEFISKGVRSSGEMKIIRKDGSIANALYTGATIELSQKRRFLVTTVMDITLRKQMEISLRLAKEQADTANRAKSAFLANMSHELRTPMNAILGFSELIINETFGPLGNEKYSEYINDVHTSAGHLLEIINEVLDMSKIEAGRIELDESEVSMADLVQSVMRMMESRIFGKDITVHQDVAENLPYIRADQRLMRQVLINLVTNAVKFSKPGGNIWISLEMLPNNVMQVIVKDDGIGIPKEKLPQAMEPFGQVTDKAENTGQQGTGLGLPLAKAMVELHEGSIALESDEGKGAIVTFRLPPSRMLTTAKAS
jgi:PAS domain S-box-containing protein